MLPLETKQPGGKLFPNRISGVGGISRGNIMQLTIQQEGLQRKEEGKSQLQDWNVDYKNLESRKQIVKFKKGNAEERGVCSRCQGITMERTR